jgi:hypothetical protein
MNLNDLLLYYNDPLRGESSSIEGFHHFLKLVEGTLLPVQAQHLHGLEFVDELALKPDPPVSHLLPGCIDYLLLEVAMVLLDQVISQPISAVLQELFPLALAEGLLL